MFVYIIDLLEVTKHGVSVSFTEIDAEARGDGEHKRMCGAVGLQPVVTFFHDHYIAIKI